MLQLTRENCKNQALVKLSHTLMKVVAFKGRRGDMSYGEGDKQRRSKIGALS